MGAAEATKSDQRSAGRADCDAALVGGGPGVWILCAQDAVWNYLRRTGGGDRLIDLDGALDRDYFPGRGVECRAGRQPQRSAKHWLTEWFAWNVTPATRATSAPPSCSSASKWWTSPKSKTVGTRPAQRIFVFSWPPANATSSAAKTPRTSGPSKPSARRGKKLNFRVRRHPTRIAQTSLKFASSQNRTSGPE